MHNIKTGDCFITAHLTGLAMSETFLNNMKGVLAYSWMKKIQELFLFVVDEELTKIVLMEKL